MEDFYDSDAWLEFRAECAAWAKERDESLIKKWLDSIGYKETVGYYRDSSNRVMEIYTRHPGILIGKAGCDVYRFQEMLSNEFRGDWKVKFIEIRGGFVNV